MAIDLITQHIHMKLQQPDLQRIYHNLVVVPSNFQMRGMHTIVRCRDTPRHEFVFYADRLLRLVTRYLHYIQWSGTGCCQFSRFIFNSFSRTHSLLQLGCCHLCREDRSRLEPRRCCAWLLCGQKLCCEKMWTVFHAAAAVLAGYAFHDFQNFLKFSGSKASALAGEGCKHAA